MKRSKEADRRGGEGVGGGGGGSIYPDLLFSLFLKTVLHMAFIIKNFHGKSIFRFIVLKSSGKYRSGIMDVVWSRKNWKK